MFRNYKRIKTHNVNQFGILPLSSFSLFVQLALHTPAGSWLYLSKQCLLRRAWQRYRCKPRFWPGIPSSRGPNPGSVGWSLAQKGQRTSEAWEPEPRAPPTWLGGAGPAGKVWGPPPGALSLGLALLRCTRSPAPEPAGAARGSSVGVPRPRPAGTFLQVAKPAGQGQLTAAPGGSRWPRTSRRRRCPGGPRAPEPAGLSSPGGMEADGDREELARLRSVFAACDANRSGRLEREEFGALCAELRVRPADAEAVFQRLDADRDGAITFQEFARGFRGLRRGGRRRGWPSGGPAPASAQAGPDPEDSEEDEGDGDALEAPWGRASSGQAWQDFQARLGDEAKFIPRCVCGLEGGRWGWSYLPFLVRWHLALNPRSGQTH